MGISKEHYMSRAITTHINEIKYRLFYSFMSFCLTFSVVFIFSDVFFQYAVYPLVDLGTKRLIFTQITEAFTASLWLSFGISFILNVPFWLSNLVFLRTRLDIRRKILCTNLVWSLACLLCSWTSRSLSVLSNSLEVLSRIWYLSKWY